MNDDLTGLREIQSLLPSYRVLFSDKAGNEERMAYIFDSSKVFELEMVGEIAVPPKDHRWIKLPGVAKDFDGSDRNPYVASFSAGNFEFVLVNVHPYYGDDTDGDRERRGLEAYATARWGDLRQDDAHTYVRDIITLGGFQFAQSRTRR